MGTVGVVPVFRLGAPRIGCWSLFSSHCTEMHTEFTRLGQLGVPHRERYRLKMI